MDALSAVPYSSSGAPPLPLAEIPKQTLPEVVLPAPVLVTAKPLSERLRVGMRVKDLNGIIHRIERFVRCGETDTVMVVYRAARNRDYDGTTWVRARSAFDKMVPTEGGVEPCFAEVA